jgi:hypothetical protein
LAIRDHFETLMPHRFVVTRNEPWLFIFTPTPQ